MLVLIPTCYGAVFKGEFKYMVKTDDSVLIPSHVTKEPMNEPSCHHHNQDISKITCYQNEVCYAMDSSSVASSPSGSGQCYMSQKVHATSRGTLSFF